MSDYKVVNAVDETLRALLWSHMQFDSEISSLLNESRIIFDAPFKLLDNLDPDDEYISIFLYRVVESPDMKNRPLERIDPGSLKYPPLSLNLFYLITPLSPNPDNEHLMLGKTMQILYDNSIVKGSILQKVLQDTPSELRIILNPMSVEDLSKIWSAFMRPMRLSVSYEVKAVFIDSERETSGERVRHKRLEFSQLSKV